MSDSVGATAGVPEARDEQPSGADQPRGADQALSADPPLSGVDLARVALRNAKAQARLRGDSVRQGKEARRTGVRSGARADGRDPQRLGAAINRLVSERGWEAPAAVGGVMGRWPQIVGRDLAAHCEPEHYSEDDRVLSVRCTSTAWATQVRLLAPQLVRTLNQELGHGTVKLIKVQGPAGPTRSYGRLRAPGSKGPGDTWG